MSGLGGTTLWIDLDEGTVKREKTSVEFMKKWLGARGVVAKLLFDEVPRDADPLGPENILIVAPGIMTGSFVPAGSKCGFGAIGPATNSHADSSVGGHFGPELKFAGYDLIVFRGQAKEPSYLYIDDDKVELRTAGDYWGLGSMDAEEKYKKDLGEDYQIAVIGPAGENGVVFACISHDFGRQAGRSGMGAVMGSKNLKAIAVRGTKALPVADLESLTKQTKDIINRTKTHPNMAPWQKLGTALFVGWANEHGTFPAYNFKSSYYDNWEKIDGTVLREKLVVADKACFGCWMNCGKYSKVDIEGKETVFVEGPEYETIALVGGSCGMDDIGNVAYGNYLCDNLGVDTISGGSVVAFAMECFEKGIITSEDLDGRTLEWGSIEDFEFLMKKITYREGSGDLLAGGTRRAAEKLGGDSIEFAIQAKGLEYSGYECRWIPSQLLSFRTADIGAHHNRSWAVTVDMELGRDVAEGKAETVVYLQHIRPLFDTLSICRLFWGELDVMPEEYLDTLKYVSGWDMDLKELLIISERIWNMNRAHLLLRNGGPGRRHERVPARHFDEEVPNGPAKGKKIPLEMAESMLDDYYRARGWDLEGNPSRALLEDLDLGYVADELEKAGCLGKDPEEGIPAVRGRELKPKAM